MNEQPTADEIRKTENPSKVHAFDPNKYLQTVELIIARYIRNGDCCCSSICMSTRASGIRNGDTIEDTRDALDVLDTTVDLLTYVQTLREANERLAEIARKAQEESAALIQKLADQSSKNDALEIDRRSAAEALVQLRKERDHYRDICQDLTDQEIESRIEVFKPGEDNGEKENDQEESPSEGPEENQENGEEKPDKTDG